jgi:hypothetical protein
MMFRQAGDSTGLWIWKISIRASFHGPVQGVVLACLPANKKDKKVFSTEEY